MHAILFDFGGTLDSSGHWLDRFVKHYWAAGFEIDRTVLDRAFSLATQKAYESNTIFCRSYSLSQLVNFLVEHQFQYLAADGLGAERDLLDLSSPERVKEIRRQICDSFVAESIVGLSRSRPLLALLARKAKIGVVSNFYGNLDRVIAEAGFAGAITAIADSGLLGFYKPDPRIFAASLAQLGVEPHDTVMVGDSISKDCAPAHGMGMTTVWLRHGQLNEPDAFCFPRPDFTINRLDELKDFEWLTG